MMCMQKRWRGRGEIFILKRERDGEPEKAIWSPKLQFGVQNFFCVNYEFIQFISQMMCLQRWITRIAYDLAFDETQFCCLLVTFFFEGRQPALNAEARKKAGLVACSIWFLSSCHIEYLNINLIFQALDEYIKYN